jgi:hypothetical protein
LPTADGSIRSITERPLVLLDRFQNNAEGTVKRARVLFCSQTAMKKAEIDRALGKPEVQK